MKYKNKQRKLFKAKIEVFEQFYETLGKKGSERTALKLVWQRDR